MFASCGTASPGTDTPSPAPASGVNTVAGQPIEAPAGAPFMVSSLGVFNEPWALATEPGTGRIFITEKPGTMRFVQPGTGEIGTVTGLPEVDYGGQGGLGDIAFAPDYAASRGVYLSWAEPGDGNTRGAAVGRGTLNCDQPGTCRIEGLEVIWRQTPKVTGSGHYSHRLEFSPDGQFLFVSSGDRQKGEPAQDVSNTLGTIVRLLPDGTPAPGNPLADRGSPADQIWSYGHRNVLGLQFDQEGQLWDLEHGPRGGDEINRIVPGNNYGWPIVSNGVNYNGSPIPDHATRPEFHAPAIGWTPVIGPGDFLFYSGKLWPEWRNQALIASLTTMSLVRVSLSGDNGTEEARYEFGNRLRDVLEAPDGSLYVIEDGDGGRLLHLTPGE